MLNLLVKFPKWHPHSGRVDIDEFCAKVVKVGVVEIDEIDELMVEPVADLGVAEIGSPIFASRLHVCVSECVWLTRKFLGVSKESGFVYGWEFYGVARAGGKGSGCVVAEGWRSLTQRRGCSESLEKKEKF